MKNEFKDYTGTVIYFDEQGYQRNLNAWEKTLLPALVKIQENFDELAFCKFNQDIYLEIVGKGLNGIKKRYYEAVNKDVTRLKSGLITKTLLAVCEESLPFDKLEKALGELHKIVIGFNGALFHYEIDYSFCSFFEDGWIIHNDRIEKFFQTVIDTPEKNEVYNRLLSLQSCYTELRQSLNAYSNYGKDNIFLDENVAGDRLITEKSDGQPDLDLRNFNQLFN